MDYSGATPSDVQVTVARDGKSAWASALASIELAKPGYKIPFTVFAVFDRAADEA